MEMVWVVDDDRSIRWVLEKALKGAEMEVRTFENAASVLQQLKQGRPAVIISDIRMPGMDGLELLEKIHTTEPDLPVIIITAHSDLGSAVNAYQGGAFEYLPKPFDVDEAVELTRRAIEVSRSQQIAEPMAETESTEIIGAAASMQEVFRAIGRLSKSNITVLINGESGTGKELVARLIHDNGPRAEKPFIPVNCGAIPEDLIESEFFGHLKGSFTGATSSKEGLFQAANQGTLFLDEIGDMPADLQTRLLRVLSLGEFYRVGGLEPIKVNVRIIAATHQNLEERVASGDFRDDLFHRLNVIRVHLPSLRERQEDIKQLTQHFLQLAAAELSVAPKTLDKKALKFLQKCRWPGNVRQLENICRYLTVMASGKEILLEDLPNELKEHRATTNSLTNESTWQKQLSAWVDEQLMQGKTDILNDATAIFEKIMLERALAFTHGHKQDAAKKLGWGRNTLTRKLKELDFN